MRLTNPHPNYLMEEGENIQINKIRDERLSITIDTEETQRIIKTYF